MQESEFLANIARRLGRAGPLTKPPRRETVGAPDFWLTYDLPIPERIDRFCQEFSDLGGEAEVFATIAELRTGLARRLAALRPARVASWGGSFLTEFGLAQVLAPYDPVVWEPSDAAGLDALVQQTAQVDVGITGCDAAIADTGTVALACDPFKGRSGSLLPATHIVLVRASQLYTRLGEALAALTQCGGGSGTDAERRRGLPSSLNFITGPSRSSDIENDLSIGVHGPAAVIAMIVRDV